MRGAFQELPSRLPLLSPLSVPMGGMCTTPYIGAEKSSGREGLSAPIPLDSWIPQAGSRPLTLSPELAEGVSYPGLCTYPQLEDLGCDETASVFPPSLLDISSSPSCASVSPSVQWPPSTPGCPSQLSH